MFFPLQFFDWKFAVNRQLIFDYFYAYKMCLWQRILAQMLPTDEMAPELQIGS